jgi:hypothetical protein
VEKGSVVQFGPEQWQNYIMNMDTGKKIMMEKKGGSFAIKANFVKKVEEDKTGFARQAK